MVKRRIIAARYTDLQNNQNIVAPYKMLLSKKLQENLEWEREMAKV